MVQEVFVTIFDAASRDGDEHTILKVRLSGRGFCNIFQSTNRMTIQKLDKNADSVEIALFTLFIVFSVLSHH